MDFWEFLEVSPGRPGLADDVGEASSIGAVKTIREVADLAGVTIRTLRHYDKVGLLKPLGRSASSGIRLYGRDELLRLREILVWRQLGFALADIAALIDQPEHDRAEALRRQFELAAGQLDKFRAITRGLERAIAAMRHGCSPTEDNVFAGFASSLSDDGSASRRIPTFALLGGRTPAAGDARVRRRVVGTDPIRIAESLLALGVMPIGTYEDRFTGAPGEAATAMTPSRRSPRRRCWPTGRTGRPRSCAT